MTDVLTPEQRRLNMSRIRGKDTKPEMAVRRLVHGLGFRYRLHDRTLPGSPDLVLPRHQKIIFVHGCFWHMHACRYGAVRPRTNAEFWQNKRLSNVLRDKRNMRELKKAGWKILVVWECWLKTPTTLEKRIRAFLSS
jgi:DNA mismatch endonuclease, patch repair protein